MSSTLSPFAAALPAPHAFFAYDADGDAVMTDAATGLPITYGGSGSKRSRSASLDSDSADSRPSKRSRTSSDDDDGDGEGGRPASPVKVPRALVGLLAPVKPPRSPRDDDADGEDGEDQGSALRNLAEQMAEAVLDGEPRDTAPVSNAASNAAADAAADGEAPLAVSQSTRVAGASPSTSLTSLFAWTCVTLVWS